jgi:hypothetical protein
VNAAVDGAILLNAVTDHPATAMGAHGSQRVNGTLEGVESVFTACHVDGEGLVVVVSAHIAFGHDFLSFVLESGPLS